MYPPWVGIGGPGGEGGWGRGGDGPGAWQKPSSVVRLQPSRESLSKLSRMQMLHWAGSRRSLPQVRSSSEVQLPPGAPPSQYCIVSLREQCARSATRSAQPMQSRMVSLSRWGHSVDRAWSQPPVWLPPPPATSWQERVSSCSILSPWGRSPEQKPSRAVRVQRARSSPCWFFPMHSWQRAWSALDRPQSCSSRRSHSSPRGGGVGGCGAQRRTADRSDTQERRVDRVGSKGRGWTHTLARDDGDEHR